MPVVHHGGAQKAMTILRLPAVKKKIGLSRSSIYAGVARGTFPGPINLGQRAVGWLEAEIDSWIESHIAATRTRVDKNG